MLSGEIKKYSKFYHSPLNIFKLNIHKGELEHDELGVISSWFNCKLVTSGDLRLITRVSITLADEATSKAK